MMNQLVVQTNSSDLMIAAKAIAKSGLFSIKDENQALALMLISQAEGRHPALAARDYDIIQGRPAKKSEAMLRDFLQSGGKVEWHNLDDDNADATFSHPQGGTVRIAWDKKRAQAAGLGGKEMWRKYPRQMLRARVVSEGIRTVCPMATSGMYVPEEVQDFDPPKPAKTEETLSIASNSQEDGLNEVIEFSQSDFDIEIMRLQLFECEQDIEAYFTWYSCNYKHFMNTTSEQAVFDEFGKLFSAMVANYSDLKSLTENYNQFRDAIKQPLYNGVRKAITASISQQYNAINNTGVAA